MSDQVLIQQMRSAVDHELRSCVSTQFTSLPETFRLMVEYQMGWEDGRSTSTGKRLRPLILLAACHALGINWASALPAAAAIELVHNFSLVHDDIQDHSETRRGKPTIWVKWGEPQAINIGDAILALATIEIYTLSFDTEKKLSSARAMQNAVFSLTKGQYLDLANENSEKTSIEDYWLMVKGKTGALFSVCFEIAAILAGKSPSEIRQYADLGLQLGLVFQVQDDALGIWGDNLITGKSTESDIHSRKKTFPIIFALENLPEFGNLWVKCKQFTQEDVDQLKTILDRSDVYQVTEMKANVLYQEFVEKFDVLFKNHEKSSVLKSMVQNLLSRNN